MNKKTSTELAEAIFIAKKNNNLAIAKAISVSTRNQAKINLEDINKAEGDVVIVPGKVLSRGEADKKKTVYALGFSEGATEKLEKAGCKFETIYDALKKDPKINGVILK